MNEGQERREAIDNWWIGTGFPGAFSADYRDDRQLEPRLRHAFERVLLAMPAVEFERFMALEPTIVCQPGVEGTAFSYRLPVWPGREEVVLRVLYFSADLYKRSDRRLVSVVAHEVAHLMLGHADDNGFQAGEGALHGEEAAERLAETWGFKGAYSAEHRRQFARQHR